MPPLPLAYKPGKVQCPYYTKGLLPTLHRHHLIHSFIHSYVLMPSSAHILPLDTRQGSMSLPPTATFLLVTQTLPVQRRHMETLGKVDEVAGKE